MDKKGMRSLCALLLALSLVFSVMPVFAENNAYVKDGSGSINLRSGPATQYRVLTALEPYTPLEVLDANGKWLHVRLSKPTATGVSEGYIYSNFVEYYDAQQIPSVSDVVPVYGSYNNYNYYNYNNYGSKVITEYTTMYVYTGNTGKLHLREGASQNARSLGLYANGTKVTVLNRSSGWAYVDVNGVRGFMMLNYLSTTQPYIPQPVHGAEIKYISTGNSGGLHLREYASQNARSLGVFPNGTQVSATNLGNGWSYVTFSGYSGYMMTRYLSAAKPYVNPTPYNPTHYKLKYVCIANGHVSLRSEMRDSGSVVGNYGNGTVVYVIYELGAWSYVFVDGKNGYMKNSWLGDSPYVPDPQPVTPVGTAVVRHPNGSFVYLRSSRSTADLSNVLAKVPSGSVVTVYQRDEWYSLISYNGIKGYMVSSYLYAANRSGSGYSNGNNSGSGFAPIPSIPLMPAKPTETAEPPASIPSIPLMPAIPTETAEPPASIPSIPLMPAIPSGGTQPGSIASGTIMYVRNPNSTYVNLRSSKDSNSVSNIIAQVYNGAQVQVLEYGEWWSYVRAGIKEGYMVTNYLSLE